MPSHCLNQIWNIVNLTIRNKLQWNVNQNSYIFIQKNVFENVVWKMAAILSRPQYVNPKPLHQLLSFIIAKAMPNWQQLSTNSCNFPEAHVWTQHDWPGFSSIIRQESKDWWFTILKLSGLSYNSISQEICTWFCCALLCCGYAIIHNKFTWSIYPYSSGLPCWHWGNR